MLTHGTEFVFTDPESFRNMENKPELRLCLGVEDCLADEVVERSEAAAEKADEECRWRMLGRTSWTSES